MHMLKQCCYTNITYARPWHDARKLHVIILDDVCFQHQHVMHGLQVEAFFYLRVWHKDHVQCHHHQQCQAAYCTPKDSFKTERLRKLNQRCTKSYAGSKLPSTLAGSAGLGSHQCIDTVLPRSNVWTCRMHASMLLHAVLQR